CPGARAAAGGSGVDGVAARRELALGRERRIVDRDAADRPDPELLEGPAVAVVDHALGRGHAVLELRLLGGRQAVLEQHALGRQQAVVVGLADDLAVEQQLDRQALRVTVAVARVTVAVARVTVAVARVTVAVARVTVAVARIAVARIAVARPVAGIAVTDPVAATIITATRERDRKGQRQERDEQTIRAGHRKSLARVPARDCGLADELSSFSD